MIRTIFKIGDERRESLCPENWNEVRLRHVLALEKSDRTDKIQILSAFTGLDVRTIENARGDLFEPMFQILTFVYDAPRWDKISPAKTVTLNHKEIKPPKKLNLETFGQKWRALDAINNTENKIDCIPEVLAIYLQPVYDGVFESSRIEDIKEMVLNMKANEAMPYGFFFFKKLRGSNLAGLIGLKISLKTFRNLLYMRKRAGATLTPTST